MVVLGYFILKYTGRQYYKSGWKARLGFEEKPLDFEDIDEPEKLVSKLPRQIFDNITGLQQRLIIEDFER